MFPNRFHLAIPVLAIWSAGAISLIAQEEPKLSEAQMREFLLKAKVIASKNTSKGITSPFRLTLSDGVITHDAGFQSIDERAARRDFANGTSEINFRDCYKYDIAAYELAKLLGLGEMMPVTVERRWSGKTGAISWWLPVKMDESTRVSKDITPPDPGAWNRQMYKKRIFAELVYDTDPNLTNVLISSDWHLWMIDFTRAFRTYRQLREPVNITKSLCSRQLLERLRKLDGAEFAQKTKDLLTKAEIDGVMARRDKIVAIYDDLIAKKGESAILYDDK
jgi:hypothetical protein